MEWIRGVPLSSLPLHTLTCETQMLIASAIISTLALLHKNNIAHGDLKPENILITSDLKVFFVDFGFSRVNSLENKHSGVIQGTPAYMAPELWSDRKTIDFKKVDVYALGVLLSRLMDDSISVDLSELTEADPELRSADGMAFEKTWSSTVQSCSDTLQKVPAAVKTAVEEYTAQILLTGARELHNRGRCEEAYALLSESLDIWPDNGDALDFLQKKFSTPLEKGTKRLFLVCASIVVAVLSVAAAYYIGRRSLMTGDILGNLSLQQEEKRLNVSLNSIDAKGSNQQTPFILRQIAHGMNLTGTVTISKVSDRGKFIIDSSPLECSPDGVSLQLSAGTHRIEWLDSTAQRHYSEIVEVLPFEKKMYL